LTGSVGRLYNQVLASFSNAIIADLVAITTPAPTRCRAAALAIEIAALQDYRRPGVLGGSRPGKGFYHSRNVSEGIEHG
jgi:hypothetical protein